MAAFTSKAAGDWSASGQTTWNEAGVPGNGDTVSITHNVTVSDARIVGTSPSDQTTVAIQINGCTLKIAAGGSLTCRGNVFLTSSTLQVGEATGGGTFEFDAHLAGTTTTQYYCAVGTANNQSPRSWLVTRGTAASPSIVRSNSGGGNGFFGSTNAVGAAPTNDRINACFLDRQYTTFLRIGTGGSAQSFYPSINSDTGITFTADHCTFDACGDERFVYDLPADTVMTYNVNLWKGTVGNWGLRFNSSAGTPTGARTITGNTFDKNPVIAIDNATITDNFFTDGWSYLQGGGKAVTIARNFIRLTPNTIDVPRSGDWSENVCVIDASTYNGAGQYTATATFVNPHWCTRGGSAAGRYAVADCVLDSFGSDGTGDIDYPNATNCYSDWSNTLILPDQISDAGVPRNAGTIVTDNGWGDNQTSTYYHLTSYSGGQGAIALAEAGNGFLAMLKFKSSIVWNDPSFSAAGFNYMAYYPTSPAGAVEDMILPADADYNVGWNVRGDGTNLGSGNTNGHYNIKASGPLGVHDIYADPQFVDKTRNFSTWVASIQATWAAGTAFPANAAPSRTDYNAHGLYLLSRAQFPLDPDYDSRYTLAALKTYVRDGFAPQNTAIKDNGHDGVTRGAIAFAGAIVPTFDTDIPPTIIPLRVNVAVIPDRSTAILAARDGAAVIQERT